jgi:Zn-dependent protease
MEGLSTIQELAVWVLPVLFAITVHEVAHGWMAMKLGDSTAKMLGRITLNPMKHIDPVGTVIVPLLMYLSSKFLFGFPLLFGWAKPVPVNWRNLRKPRRDMALVAAAGPGANLLMAVMWALIARFGYGMASTSEWVGLPLIYMGAAGVLINAILMLLNLMPIPPLDGGRVIASLLPPKTALVYSRLEPWGLFIVVGLLASGLLGQILGPLVQWTQKVLFTLVGLG